ncbi:hypothetical protein [Arthrobacter sp. NPDC092385]|uniref:hypothetical protein n=1 Tax=Arthrobacter sp. NPDC092385 TaxID=3363943 RepID=UPI00381B93C4
MASIVASALHATPLLAVAGSAERTAALRRTPVTRSLSLTRGTRLPGTVPTLAGTARRRVTTSPESGLLVGGRTGRGAAAGRRATQLRSTAVIRPPLGTLRGSTIRPALVLARPIVAPLACGTTALLTRPSITCGTRAVTLLVLAISALTAAGALRASRLGLALPRGSAAGRPSTAARSPGPALGTCATTIIAGRTAVTGRAAALWSLRERLVVSPGAIVAAGSRSP